MKSKLFRGYVRECEMHNAHVVNGNPNDIMITNQRLSALEGTFENAGLILHNERRADDIIVSVTMYENGDLLDVCETLWDGR